MPGHDTARASALASIARLDPVGLASLVGGLLLVPENLHHVHRFEVLANMVLAGHASGHGDVTRTRARKVLDEFLGAWTGHNDDPWPNLATEAFVYHGGNHVFIPGGIDRVFVLRGLARTIATSDDLPKDFRERSIGLIQFACVLSDDALGRAGLGRNLAVPLPGPIVVPPGARLQQLHAAVCMTSARFAELRAAARIGRIDAERFCLAVGCAQEPAPLESYAHLQYAPLVRVGDAVIVIAPHLIADAAIRHLLIVAREMDAGPQLADEFHLASFIMLDESLERLGLHASTPPRRSFTTTPGSIVSHILYQCDRDKIQHVMLASDALTGVPTEPWNTDALSEELKFAKAGLVNVVARFVPPVVDWRSVVVAAGIGSNFSITLDQDDARTWALSAGDCDAIAYAEERDPLLLWKYQIAYEETRQTTRLMSSAPLDTYAMWRAWGRKFTPDNTSDANFIGVSPDSGEMVRHDALRKRDWRALPSWRRDQVTEVGLAEGPERPIYVTRGSSGKRFEIAVETEGPLVWFVLGTAVAPDREASERRLDLVRMASFWIAEFADELKPQLATSPDQPIVVVTLDWVGAAEVDAAPYTISVEDVSVHVHATARFLETYDDTNTAEREFAQSLAVAVFAVAGLPDAENVIASVVDVVAPLGVKRMLHAINAARNLAFTRPAALPEARHVQDFDVQRARRVALGPDGSIGLLQADAAHTWLNAAVARLYGALRASLSEHDGHDALADLLPRYEALVLEDDLRDLTFASVLACAERVPTLRRDLEGRIGRHARSASATRFLIEHLAAEPSSGARRTSLATFDEWLALAAEIIALGYVSDVARYGLASVGVRVGLVSYDLDLGGYADAVIEGHGQRHAERFDLEDERSRVPGTGVGSADTHTREAPALPAILAAVNVGAEAEFGRGLQDLGFFFGEALALAEERESELVAEPLDVIVARFSARLGWSQQAVRECLEHFVLAPRAAFTAIPQGHLPSDIWPWKFNRSLSYIRRPFVRTRDGNIYYTPGHVMAASQNLLMLLTTARYRATTKELRAAMDSFAQAPSREFVEDVGAVFSERGFVVKTHVEKIGDLKIEHARGHGLGDVDVLVADRAARRIIAVECKDLQLDRMPHEMSTDLQALFVGTTTKPSAQDKHLARLRWLEAHRTQVVRWLVGEDEDGWRIDAAMVVSRALVSPYLGRALLPVWTARQIRRGDGP